MQVARQLDLITGRLKLFSVDLDDAGHRLAGDMLVPINDHVETLIDETQSGRSKLVEVRSLLALHVDVLGRRDLPLLPHGLPLDLLLNLVGVSEGSVVALPHDALLNDSSAVGSVVLGQLQERLDNLRFLIVLFFGDVDWNMGVVTLLVGLQQVLLVELVAGLVP